MTRVLLLAAPILYCVLSPTLSEPATWLMQGDLLTDEEAIPRLIQLETHKTYFPVSTKAHMYYRARRGKLVTCVIAAAVHQKGRVSVTEGGLGADKIRVLYTSDNGEPDVFFVLVQAAKRDSVSVEGNIAKSTRLDVVYEPVRNWTVQEIQDALRNANASFLPS